jgi:hypothetical protein
MNSLSIGEFISLFHFGKNRQDAVSGIEEDKKKKRLEN